MTALTISSETGLTGGFSRAGDRPARSPETVRRDFVNGGGNELLGHTPFEHADNSTDPAIDLATAVAGPDHFSPHSLKARGPKELAVDRAIESADASKHQPDILRLDRGAAVIYVVTVGELDVSQDQLVNRQGRDSLSGLALSAERHLPTGYAHRQ